VAYAFSPLVTELVRQHTAAGLGREFKPRFRSVIDGGLAEFYHPDQPRDERGRWVSGGGSGSANKAPANGGKKAGKATGSKGKPDKVLEEAKRLSKTGKASEIKKIATNIRQAERERRIDREFKKQAQSGDIKSKVGTVQKIYKGELEYHNGPFSEEHIGTTNEKLAALTKVPPELHQAVVKAGGRIAITPGMIPDISEAKYLADIQPRGWSAGKTLKDCSAVFIPSKNLAICGGNARTEPGRQFGQVTLHEVGHQVAKLYGQESMAAAYTAHDKFVSKLSETQKVSLHYFVTNTSKQSAVSEALGESFKDYHFYGPQYCSHR
jgi:Anthrax toxin lethal factor, N- and C-terminal domain